MDAPVVVNPDTLSNHAFTIVKGPPHKAYGSMPKMKERSQDRKMMRYPSLRLISGALLTNMKGNIPTVKVMVKLISRAARALSLPFATETRMEKNMNRALTSNATPTYLDITFTFISRCY